MAETSTLESPFGRLETEVLGGALLPLARGRDKRGRGSGATHPAIPVVVLVDPSPAVLDLVTHRCFQRSPERCALTRWHVLGGHTHTKLVFFLRDPKEVLQLLEEAAHDEREADAHSRARTGPVEGCL
jgi:hypothetical protein